MSGFTVKRPKVSPAISLIHRGISADVMGEVLRQLDAHSAGRWEIGRIGHSRTDGDYFTVTYWPIIPIRPNETGRAWEMVFGFDGSLWMD